MIRSVETTVLLATSNPGKARELKRMLPAQFAVVTLADLAIPSPAETGARFADIAAAKALHAHHASGLLTIADDSGLEVDALGGLPGIRSARFAGEPANDVRNVAELLSRLDGIPPQRRSARFRCSVAVAVRAGIAAQADGVCEGAIATRPRGSHGFGYDPVFLLPNGRTMAELSADEKSQISHRGIAFRAILPSLLALARECSPAGGTLP